MTIEATLRGNTRNPNYRQLVQLYEFNRLLKWTRRNITPTDIDGRYYIHSGLHGKDNFLFFELKNIGSPIPRGQDKAINGLCRLGRGSVCFIIAEHPKLVSVEIPLDIVRFKLRMFDTARQDIAETGWLANTGGELVGEWVKQWFHFVEGTNHSSFISTFRWLSKRK